MAKLPSLVDMLKAGTHFGHRTSKWHPNMEPYIFTNRGGVHIINLEETQKKLEEAGEFLKKLGMEGGTLLFVGTKRQAKDLIKEKAMECNMPYVVERWIGGTLTNFGTIRNRIKYFLDLKKKQESGDLAKYTKKEQSDFGKEIADLELKIGGLSVLDKAPNAIFILDLKLEKTARREAEKRNIPIIAVCDTNVDPFGIKYPIPANDDAMKSINIIVDYLAESLKEGQALQIPREQMKKIEENKKEVKAPKKENKEEKKEVEKKVKKEVVVKDAKKVEDKK